jgi:hypothetical protein
VSLVEQLSSKPVQLGPGLAQAVGIPAWQRIRLSYTELIPGPMGGDPGVVFLQFSHTDLGPSRS